jgi:Rrf2 family nitric oxide-sensitive transcriptional repressor
MKVVQHLGHLGYLETVRGKGGGLRLAVPASEIRLGDVVRDVEGGFDIVPCFDKTRPDICVIAPACVLKGVLRGALSAFLDVLDGYTLEDLIGPKRPLRSLLALKVQGARPPRRARAVRAQA